MVLRPGMKSNGQRAGVVSLVLGAFLLVVGLLTAPALADDPVEVTEEVPEVVETTVAPPETTVAPPETTVAVAPQTISDERTLPLAAPTAATGVPAAVGPISLKSSQQNTGYADYLDNDACPGITLAPGQVAWHFVMGPLGGTPTEAGTLLTWPAGGVPIPGVSPGSTTGGGIQGANADWFIVNSLTDVGTGPTAVSDGDSQGGGTELRISHTCFGGSTSSSSTSSSSTSSSSTSTSSSTSSSSVSSSSTSTSSSTSSSSVSASSTATSSSSTGGSFPPDPGSTSSSSPGGGSDGDGDGGAGVRVVPASTGDTLPRTGGNSATAVLIGGLLVVLGLLLIRYGRHTD